MLELDNLFDTHIITCIKFCYCALLSKFFFLTQNVHATIDIIIAGIYWSFFCAFTQQFWTLYLKDMLIY